jgi:hypothetical protein
VGLREGQKWRFRCETAIKGLKKDNFAWILPMYRNPQSVSRTECHFPIHFKIIDNNIFDFSFSNPKKKMGILAKGILLPNLA